MDPGFPGWGTFFQPMLRSGIEAGCMPPVTRQHLCRAGARPVAMAGSSASGLLGDQGEAHGHLHLVTLQGLVVIRQVVRIFLEMGQGKTMG